MNLPLKTHSKFLPAHQWGGTLLGLAIGLVLGLATAIIVAIYITRAPVPFMDRGVPPHTAVSKDIGKPLIVDPNIALQSKVPVQASEPVSSSNTEAAPNQATVNEDSNAAAPIIEGKKPIAVSPVPSSPAEKASAPARKLRYFLQAGAYKNASDAEQQRARLALEGVEAKVIQANENGATFFRVRIGPYTKTEDAEQLRSRLSDAGFQVTVLRVAT